MSVSVIICAYTEERWDNLLDAVQSMRNQTIVPDEVIIIIDHNHDLFLRAKEHIHDATIIENSKRQGLSGARNSGIAIAKGDIIAFMDEDATAAPNWVEKLLGGYTSPNIWGVGGTVEPVWLTGRPSWFPEEFDWVVGCTHSAMPKTTIQVRNLVGCNMSFRREVFESVGTFTDGIGRVGKVPVGCEETELCIRANQKNPDHLIMYEPTARVYHLVPGSRANWRYFRSRCYSEGLSKALVSELVGAGSALSAERSYTLRALPLGFFRGIMDTVSLRKPAGITRSVAIFSGLAITTFGYLRAKITRRFMNKQ